MNMRHPAYRQHHPPLDRFRIIDYDLRLLSADFTELLTQIYLLHLRHAECPYGMRSILQRTLRIFYCQNWGSAVFVKQQPIPDAQELYFMPGEQVNVALGHAPLPAYPGQIMD